MAKLQAVVEKLDTLPEPVRGLYVERDGKFYLDAEGVEDVSGLKSALEAQKQAAKEAKERLKAYGDLTPEKAKEMAEQAATAERQRLEKKGEWDKLRDQLVEQHGKQVEAKDTEIHKRDQIIETLVGESAAKSALSEAEGDIDLLLPHVMKRIKVEQKDGTAIAIVKDDAGNARLSPKGDGKPMTIKELVEDMKKSTTFGRGFKGTQASGSGAPASGGAPALTGGKIVLTREQAKDARVYRAAKERAAKEGLEITIQPA